MPRRRASQAHAVEALGALLEFAVERLNELRFVGGLHSPAVVVSRLGSLCRSFSERLAADPRVPYLLAFVRHALAKKNFCYALDGIPRGFALDGPFAGSPMAPEAARALRAQQVSALRHTRAVEAMIGNRGARLADLPAGLRPEAHEFASVCRKLSQGLAAVKPAMHFRDCSNTLCGRRFYVGSAFEHKPPDFKSGTEEYWSNLSGRLVPRNRRFCCFVCAKQHGEELRRLVPEPPPEGGGASSVRGALARALKRNALLSREIRLRARDGKPRAATQQEVELERVARVTALNIDVGLLVAAASLAETPVEARQKLLPGIRVDWRETPSLFMRAVAQIGPIFERYGHRDLVIQEVHAENRFLDEVRKHAKRFF